MSVNGKSVLLQGALAAALLLILCAQSAKASVVDFDSETPLYPAGNLSHTFVDVEGTGPGKGTDVKFTFSEDTDFLVQTIPPYPRVTNAPFTGGTAEKALQILVNFDDSSEKITFEIEFFKTGTTNRQLVRGVSFSLRDVDKVDIPLIDVFDFEDEASDFRTIPISGAPIGPVTVAPGATNAVTGSGINFKATGDDENPNSSEDGNVFVNFGGQALKGISFVYGNGPGAPADPFLQGIALHDITFSVVPEAGTVAGLAGFFLLAVLLHQFHIRRSDRRTSRDS